MKTASKILLLLSIALICYGYWGAFTSSGNKVYDEMDGVIPFGIMLLGCLLLIIVIVMLIWNRRIKK
ncbi:MAG: hypothetical protein V4685_08080 [Bacteroidota bacterium]